MCRLWWNKNARTGSACIRTDKYLIFENVKVILRPYYSRMRRDIDSILLIMRCWQVSAVFGYRHCGQRGMGYLRARRTFAYSRPLASRLATRGVSDSDRGMGINVGTISTKSSKSASSRHSPFGDGDPYENRTRVFAVRGRQISHLRTIPDREHITKIMQFTYLMILSVRHRSPMLITEVLPKMR